MIVLKSERKFDAGLLLAALCSCSDSPPAPDYGPTAAATEAAARISADLGREQIAESRRQYDKNISIAKPVVDAQLDIMEQSAEQGADYFDYLKTKARPVENALNDDAMKAGSEASQQEAADRAVADSQGGFTRALNQTIRQGKRYGLSEEAMGATTGDMAVQQAAKTAGAATMARDKDEAMGYAKKLDVAGLYRGMPGASSGAYQVATQAGNSAVNNQMAPGGQLLAGMNQGAGTMMQGQQLSMQGNLGILNAQSQMARADDGMGGLLGGIGGLAQGAGAAYTAFSSEELKEDKEPIEGALESLRKLPVEQWKYKDGVADEGEHVGPYAEDVHEEFGDTAAPGGKTLDLVTMNGLLLKGIQELADKVDAIDGKKVKVAEAGPSLRKAPMARSGEGRV